ncbi:hypothetical protein ACLKA6_018383 [Drosophila palustris]
MNNVAAVWEGQQQQQLVVVWLLLQRRFIIKSASLPPSRGVVFKIMVINFGIKQRRQTVVTVNIVSCCPTHFPPGNTNTNTNNNNNNNKCAPREFAKSTNRRREKR